jgi:type VI secretion system secreted protein VgrG
MAMQSAATVSSAENANRNSADRADFLFSVEGLESIELRVVKFEGEEEIGELYSFAVTITCDDEIGDLAPLPGRACLLEIASFADESNGPISRHVHGIIRQIERIDRSSRQVRYAIEFVPRQWLLTRRWQSRIFQEHNCPDMSVPGIIRRALLDAGMPESSFRFALHGQHTAREYVVQYRESDMDFVSRLMEDEGLFFFFEHTVDGCCMIIADGPTGHPTNPDVSDFIFRDPRGLEPQVEHVYHVSDSHEVRSGRVTLDDFDFKRPAFELKSSKGDKQFAALEISDYPGGFDDRDVGQRLAQIRLEEKTWPRHVMRMESIIRCLRAGFRFTLSEHPQESLNREYVAVSVTHSAAEYAGAQEDNLVPPALAYRCRITALPADVPYRAPRRTAKPFAHGSQTAIVVGPQSEEIYVDEYGRVKVQFHWDRQGEYNEHSSCWIRVSQGLAGGNYGMMFLPRVGQEVIVDFLEGNPDRPVITGRVYNKDHMPPYALPDAKSISTIRTCSTPGAKGGNEIRFDDAKGSEQLLLFAQKDMHFRAKAGRFESTGGNRHATVSGDEFEQIQKNQHLTVGLDQLETIGGNVERTVRGDIREECQGSKRSAFVGGVTLSTAAFRVESSSIVLTCGGNFIKIDSSGVTIVGAMVDINSGGSAGPDQSFPAAKVIKTPTPAATIEFGHNTRYNAAPETLAALEPVDVVGGPDDPAVATEVVWIEIELIDEAGMPCAGERYELRLPDGAIRRGALNEHGLAHESVPQAGICEISFPKLDAAAWERIG